MQSFHATQIPGTQGMNTTQKKIVGAASLLIFIMLLFPPFKAVREGGTYNLGYGFILAPPLKYAMVNVSLLLVQWFVVAIVTAAGLMFINTQSTEYFRGDGNERLRKRTIRQVQNRNSAESVIAAWAASEKNVIRQNGGRVASWTKNLGMLPYPAGPRLIVEYSKETGTLELFINLSKYGQLKTLGTIGPETALDDTGLKGALPREMVRAMVNRLLIDLDLETV